MKALTIWQPWGTLIMALAKPYEFRKASYLDVRSYRNAPAPGERFVIHAGSRKMRRAEIEDILARCQTGDTALIADRAVPILERALASPETIPLAAGLGTVAMQSPVHSSKLFPSFHDSDRIDHQLWAWPLVDIKPFEPIRPCRGAQGFWTWPKDLAA